MTTDNICYEIMINIEKRGCPRKSFKEAWLAFMEETRKELQKGTSWQVLETTYFLIFKFNENELVFSFYEARDFAYTIGLMKNGEIHSDYDDTIMEPTVRRILGAFKHKNISDCIKDIQERIGIDPLKE